MKTLNLTNSVKSDIDYKVSNFPDGQQDVTILTKGFYSNGLFKYDLNMPESDVNYHWTKGPVKIASRFNSFRDLELIVCVTKALRRLKVKEIHLYVPYLLGARSDRKFVDGGTSYLVDVIAPIINAQGFESVTVIDVHSDVASACINNLEIIDNVDLVKFMFDHMTEKNGGSWNQPIVISPDAGSLKKIYNVTKKVGIYTNVVTCSKYRDTDGKLSKTNVPLGVHDVDKDLVIIDDICDGGRTFINIVDAINDIRGLSSVVHPSNYGKIYLIVTHGIFSAGFDELSKHFDGIFCTNSVKDITRETMELETKNKFELIQMNVF